MYAAKVFFLSIFYLLYVHLTFFETDKRERERVRKRERKRKKKSERE